MASRRRFSSRIRQLYRRNQLAFQLLLILGGTLLVIGGFILYAKQFMGTRAPAFNEEPTLTEEEMEVFVQRPADQAFPQPVSGERHTLRAVVDYALTAHGGRTRLEGVRTLRRIGTVELRQADGSTSEMDATIIYRRPDRIRYVYEADGRSATIAYDGQEAWQQFRSFGQPGSVTTVPTEDRRLIEIDLVTTQPLSLTLQRLDQLQLLPPERPLDALDEATTQEPYRVRRELSDMLDTLHFDPENFLLVRRTVELLGTEGEPLVIEIEYEDYRYVDRIAFPFRLRSTLSGELSNVLRLERIELNPGVLPYVFERPEDPEAPAGG
ncbi:MAG: hypothetical protein ACLFR7_12655 [Opitutales bacterium]